MNIENLKEGQIIKNYKELCVLLNVTPTKGKGRQYHIKELERYCEYKKQGQKFIIENVFNNPLPYIDNRVNGNHKKHYSNFFILEEDENKNGIYIIQKNNDVYIGSTFSKKGFKHRYTKHLNNSDNNHIKTSKLLENNDGSFKTLFIAEDNNIQDEVLIRMIEEEYIKYYKRYTNYNVINTRESTFSYTEPAKPKKDFTNIKIETDDIEMVINFLKENYIDFKLK